MGKSKITNRTLKKIIVIGSSVIVAGIVFVGLLTLQEKVINPHGKAMAFQLKQDITKNTLIDRDNIKNYVEKVEVPKNFIVSEAVTMPNEVLDHISTENLNKGTILAKNYFINKKSILNKIQNPVEVSFTTRDISEVLGGTLRKGDVIDLSVIEKDNQSKKIIVGAYVDKVFSGDNKKVESGSDAASMTINVIIGSADLNNFNDAVANGKIRVSMNK